MRMHIAIRFSDNDFYCTVKSFLELILNALTQSYEPIKLENLTKKRIVELFNATASSLYWLNQNGYTYQLDWDASDYLKIKEEHVFLGDEVIKYVENCKGWDNSEFHILWDSGEITSI